MKNSIKTEIYKTGRRRGECICPAQQKELLKANKSTREIPLPT